MSLSIFSFEVPRARPALFLMLLVLMPGFASTAWAKSPTSDPGDTDIISLAQGDVRGIRQSGFERFLGIPYAKPPIGERRWKVATPVSVHKGTMEATEFGSACVQSANPQIRTSANSEDCLTLNIWRPNKAGKPLPVMVWIHGGGFNMGSGEIPGEIMATRDLVVVSFNYRLGLLGFFAHPVLDEKVANFGLTDAVLALQWIQENIAAFGGDPENITIFGGSAGAMMVNLLLVSEQAEGLFHKAIAQSGYISWPLPATKKAQANAVRYIDGSEQKPAEQLGAELLLPLQEKKGESNLTLETLRSLDAHELVGLVKGFTVPIVDGVTLEDQPYRLAASRSLQVPLITGGNSFEGSIMNYSGVSVSEYKRSWQTQEPGSGVEDLYTDDWAVSRELAYSRAFGDERYLLSAYHLGNQWQRKKAPAWLYFLDSAALSGTHGAPHGADQYLLFHSASQAAGSAVNPGDLIRDYWANFARTGDPNGPNGPNDDALPQWPAYTTDERLWLKLGDDTVPVKIKSKIMPVLEQRLYAREQQTQKK